MEVFLSSALIIAGYCLTLGDGENRCSLSTVLHHEIRPPTPRSEATVFGVTRGNIAELAATAFVALLIVLLSLRTIGSKGKQSAAERVSVNPN
jgi:hypothetical protein